MASNVTTDPQHTGQHRRLCIAKVLETIQPLATGDARLFRGRFNELMTQNSSAVRAKLQTWQAESALWSVLIADISRWTIARLTDPTAHPAQRRAALRDGTAKNAQPFQ